MVEEVEEFKEVQDEAADVCGSVEEASVGSSQARVQSITC